MHPQYRSDRPGDCPSYHKDLDILLGLMHEAGLPAPAAALAMQQINAMMSAGDARRDLSGLVRVLERMAAPDAPRPVTGKPERP